MIKRLVFRLRGDHTTEQLIKRGLIVGKNFNRMVGTIIDPAHCWHIEIGDNVTLAPRVHILAHDASFKLFLGYVRVGNVKIGNDVFIGAESVVLPGVTIGNRCIIGANSTVTRDIPDGSVAVGSPAIVISDIDSFLNREEERISTSVKYDDSFTLRNPAFDVNMKNQMIRTCKENGFIYVR